MLYEPKTDPRLPFLIVEDVRTYRIKGGKKRMRLRTAIRDYCQPRIWAKRRAQQYTNINKYWDWLEEKGNLFGFNYDRLTLRRYVRFVEHLMRYRSSND